MNAKHQIVLTIGGPDNPDPDVRLEDLDLLFEDALASHAYWIEDSEHRVVIDEESPIDTKLEGDG